MSCDKTAQPIGTSAHWQLLHQTECYTISLQRLGASLRYEIPNNSENPAFLPVSRYLLTNHH